MSIPLFDPRAQYRELRGEIDAAVLAVLDSGSYILGPQVEAFERELASFVGATHAVGVGSGTDALVLALDAAGIGPGDEVLVPAYSFFATAEAVLRVGAAPVFADVEWGSCCLDMADAARRVTPATRAIVAVHLYGHPADLPAAAALAAEHDLVVIEDAAQAFGSSLGGRRAGALGSAGCLSFFPTKTLGGFGDGGMVVTDDDTLAERVRLLRAHGFAGKGNAVEVGYNSRLDPVQAAALRVKLPHAQIWHARRRAIAERYRVGLDGAAGIETPTEAPGAEHTYGLYVIKSRGRDGLRAALAEAGIATGVYYDLPLPFAPVFAGSASAGDFPVAERLALETLALPMFPHLTDDEVDRVVEAVRDAVSG